MIVIVYQRRDSGDEAEFGGVMLKAIPEDRFGFFGFESAVLVSNTRGDEVDRVVAIPVLKAVVVLVIFVARLGSATETGHGCRLSGRWAHRKFARR